MASRNEKMSAVLELGGLDMVSPTDNIQKGRTPYSKNFRLFAKDPDDRQVAVSSRKGPGFYVDPIAEALTYSNTAVTGADTATVGVITNIHAQPFTATNNERITRVDISVSDTVSVNVPLKVGIYTELNDTLTLLGESSLLSGDISETPGYVTARFVEAVQTIDEDVYWRSKMMATTQSSTHLTPQLMVTSHGRPTHRCRN